jgi:hypothetical protein
VSKRKKKRKIKANINIKRKKSKAIKKTIKALQHLKSKNGASFTKKRAHPHRTPSALFYVA